MSTQEMNLMSYLVRLIIFTCLILLISYAVEPAVPAQFKSGFIYYLIYFFAAATFILHFTLNKISKEKPKRFITVFMAATGLKLFLFLALLLAMVFLYPEVAVGIIIEFFLLYLLYTVFETYFMLKLRQKQQQ